MLSSDRRLFPNPIPNFRGGAKISQSDEWPTIHSERRFQYGSSHKHNPV